VPCPAALPIPRQSLPAQLDLGLEARPRDEHVRRHEADAVVTRRGGLGRRSGRRAGAGGSSAGSSAVNATDTTRWSIGRRNRASSSVWTSRTICFAGRLDEVRMWISWMSSPSA
jgi:hypothetical protein